MRRSNCRSRLFSNRRADVVATEANLKLAQEERARYDQLMKTGSGTVQRAQQTDATLRAQTAQLQQGKAGLVAANKKIEVLSTERAKAVGQLDHARAVEQQAGLNLSYTQITAPVDGTVGAALAPARPICAGRNTVDGGRYSEVACVAMIAGEIVDKLLALPAAVTRTAETIGNPAQNSAKRKLEAQQT